MNLRVPPNTVDSHKKGFCRSVHVLLPVWVVDSPLVAGAALPCVLILLPEHFLPVVLGFQNNHRVG